MQLLNDIKNLPVYTKNGKYLGRIVEFEFDASSQLITRYHVSQWPVLSGLWQGKLLIAREQVISISNAAMVVDDSVAEAKAIPEADAVAG